MTDESGSTDESGRTDESSRTDESGSTDEIAVDARGQRCPMPIIALGRAARGVYPGAVLAVTCTDPGAEYDVPAWCAMKGADYLGSHTEGDGAVTYRVRLN